MRGREWQRQGSTAPSSWFHLSYSKTKMAEYACTVITHMFDMFPQLSCCLNDVSLQNYQSTVLPTYMSASHDVQITLFHHLKVDLKNKKKLWKYSKNYQTFPTDFCIASTFTPKTAAVCNKHVQFPVAFTHRLCSWIIQSKAQRTTQSSLLK